MTTNLVKLLDRLESYDLLTLVYEKNGVGYEAEKELKILFAVIRLQAEGLENCNCHHVAKETELKLEKLLEDAT